MSSSSVDVRGTFWLWVNKQLIKYKSTYSFLYPLKVQKCFPTVSAIHILFKTHFKGSEICDKIKGESFEKYLLDGALIKVGRRQHVEFERDDHRIVGLALETVESKLNFDDENGTGFGTEILNLLYNNTTQ